MASAQTHGINDQASARRDRHAETLPNALGVISRGVTLIGSLATSFLVVYNELLQVQVTEKHDPDVVTALNRPFVIAFNHYVAAPAAKIVQTIGNELRLVSSLNIGAWLQDPFVSRLVASTILSLVGVSLAYFSVLGLLRVYGQDTSYKLLRRFSFVVISILLLPLAMLSAVHVLQRVFGFVLLPTATDIVSDYVFVTHAAADAIYGRWFHWAPPLWLKDAAAISLISVGINRKAWLPNETGTYALAWDDFVDWVRTVVHIRSVFNAVELVPQLIAMLAGFGVGKFFEIIRLRWLSERLAALTFVVLRGLMLVGLVYPIEHAFELAKWWRGSGADNVEERGAALWYIAYMGVTIVLVTWFVVALHYVPPSHLHKP